MDLSESVGAGRTREPHGVPVEMSEDEAPALVHALSRLIEEIRREAGDPSR
jgi:hypothetical protein